MKIYIIWWIILLSLFCKTNSEIIYAPPNLDPVIEKVEKSDIKPELKNTISVALNECKAYSEKCYADNQELNNRIANLERVVAKQQKELETWRTIKKWVFIAVLSVLIFIILSLLWKYKSLILKLAGVPIP